MLYPCVAPIVIPPKAKLDNNLSISERNLIRNSFWLSLSNFPSDSAITFNKADVSIVTLSITFSVFSFTFSSVFAFIISFFSAGFKFAFSFSTSLTASFLASSSMTSISLIIFSGTSSVAVSITAGAFFSVVVGIILSSFFNSLIRCWLFLDASSSFFLRSCDLARRALYCSIIASHSSSVLPVALFISAFAFSMSDAFSVVVVVFTFGVRGLRSVFGFVSFTGLTTSTVASPKFSNLFSKVLIASRKSL